MIWDFQTERLQAITPYLLVGTPDPMTTPERSGTMKNGVHWDVTPCGFCKNRRFGGTQRLLHQGDNR
jgi:hypothetical protein